MKPILQVKDLRISFRSQGQKIEAIRGVSFEVPHNQKIGIVGESGSGKTVLMKSLLNLLPSHHTIIESGEIWYKETNLLSLKESGMQKIRGKEIGMIFQDPLTALNPTVQVGIQITESVILHHPLLHFQEAKMQAIQLLFRVGISEPEKRFYEYPHTLSGGMRQRILIAIALAANPSLLIADEPTTALDVTIQAQIFELLHLLQKNKSTILITHDLSLVAGFCDRVLVLYAGKIVEDAPVDRLFSSPQHPYTQKLLLSLPRIDLDKNAPLIPIPGLPPSPGECISGCAFHQRCSKALNICKQEAPPSFIIAQNHRSACWLHDARNTA